MYSTIKVVRNSLWLGGWIRVTDEEIAVVNAINERVMEENRKLESTLEYKKEQRRIEYLKLKEEFEGTESECSYNKEEIG